MLIAISPVSTCREGQHSNSRDAEIPYSGYFSRDNIFVVFVVQRRTTKYLHTKKRESKRDHASVIMLLARARCLRCERASEYCTRGAVLRVEVSYGLISLL